MRLNAGIRAFPRPVWPQWRPARVVCGRLKDTDSPLTVAAPCGIRTHFPCTAGRSSYVGASITLGDMPRRSTATVRRQPVANVTTSTGPVAIYSETLAVETTERVQVIDLTELVMEHVHRWPVREGLVTLSSMHTTLTLFINEHQQALLADMKTFLEQVVKDDHGWLHNDPDHSDCDRANADSHLRALLLGHSLTLPLSGGEIVLGQWQRILMGELDGPRSRSLRLQVMGVAEGGA